MKTNNLIILGTSHIAKQSLKEVNSTIEKEKPDIIAVELDRRRLYGLLSNEKSKFRISDIKLIGVRGFLFSLLGGYIQKKLGNIVGVSPGSEMLAAVKIAKEKNLKIELIDQDILITLRRVSNNFGVKVISRAVIDTVKSILFKKKMMKEYGIANLDLTKVPEKKLISKIIKIVKKKYPGLYKVLIEERNIVMANNLKKLFEKYPGEKILAVVGAGHEEGILDLIKSEPEITYSFKINP